MARSLGIETSGRIGSIALVRDGEVLVEREFEHGLKNAARILPLIDESMRSLGWKPMELTEIHVSIGPGSFTGLRVAATLAKTLSMTTPAKLVAVPTVRVLAQNAPAEATNLLIVLDAKRGQIFTARFARSGDSWVEHEPAHLDTLAAALARSPRPVHLLGEGIPYHERSIPADDVGITRTEPTRWRARASEVARIGAEMARRGEFADPLTLMPLYIRLPEAEEKLLERGKSGQAT
jgi:tRNA threonylcarbamoyladenosine biosynthesis protein TsaB